MGWEYTCVKLWLDEGQIHTLCHGEQNRPHAYACGVHSHKAHYRAKVTASNGNKPCRKELKTDRPHPHHLPETFNVRDEKVGIWWIAVATGHLNRTGAIPGG